MCELAPVKYCWNYRPQQTMTLNPVGPGGDNKFLKSGLALLESGPEAFGRLAPCSAEEDSKVLKIMNHAARLPKTG